MESELSPANWKLVALGELGEVNRGRSRHRPRDAAHLYGGPYPFVQTGDIKGASGRITSYEQSYSEEGLLQSRLWPTETMCITIAANIAETAILTFPACFPDSVVGFIADTSKCNVRFIEYVFRQLRRRIQNEATGSVQDNINLAILAKLRFLLPPLHEQHDIVSVLGGLDAMIEAARKSRQTLEAIARAIFKSWFVDFDPVRAKAEGREPEGMDAATAALFPGSFEQSEGTAIPSGWNLRNLSNFMEINPTRSLSKANPAPYLDMANAPTAGPRPYTWIERQPISGCRFRNGDTLLAKITPCLENGKTAFVDFLTEGQTGWGSTEFIVLTPVEPIPAAFGYLLARHEDFRNFAVQSMSGTSGRQRVQVDQLAKFKFAVADGAIYKAFGNIIEPMFAAISHNDVQAKTLAELRDTLLPRLISGKLRVPEAEKLVEAVL